MGKDEENESSRGFKVSDRRRFVDDAEPAAEETREAAPAAERAAAADAHDYGHHTDEPPPHEMNFSTFVMGLSTQALMHLGEIPDPEAPHGPDLSAAKQMIDLLGILRDKTTGNLEPAEEQLLSSMLYDLRMRYVEVSR
jgi:hypothetical protein